jgi:hypothetical protein
MSEPEPEPERDLLQEALDAIDMSHFSESDLAMIDELARAMGEAIMLSIE